MKSSVSLAVVGTAAIVSALPASVCQKLSTALSAFNKGPQATSFCSSLLHISTATVTSSATLAPQTSTISTALTLTLDPATLIETDTTTLTVTTTSTTSTQATVTTTATITTYVPYSLTCASTAGNLIPTTILPNNGPIEARNAPPCSTTLSSSSKKSSSHSSSTSTKISTSCKSTSTRASSTSNPAKSSSTSCKKTTSSASSTAGKTSSVAPPIVTPTSVLSSLCSCLSLTTPTSTSVATITPAPVTTTTTNTITSSPSVTSTTTLTLTATTTEVLSIVVDPVTTTLTATVSQPTPTSFGGLDYYAYHHNYNFNLEQPGWDVTTFNSPNFYESGTLQNINDVHTYNFPSSSTTACMLPGRSAYENCAYIAVVMQGYLFAAETGQYTFAVPATVDNFFGIWSGQTAYNAYNNGNADFIGLREGAGPYNGGSGTYQLQAGQYFPVTAIYMNGGGIGGIAMTVTTPDGVVHQDTTGLFIPACPDANQFSP